MIHTVSKGALSSSGSSDPSTEGSISDPSLQAGRFAGAFTETGSVAVAALLHLMRLMGSELVLTQSGCETERFEQAVRAKIGQFLSPTSNPQVREAGLALARHLVEQLMTQIRAQAQLQKSLSSVSHKETASQETAPSARLTRSLN